MSLIHYAQPFLELGICKEYCMARKTTGSSTTTRSKKTAAPIQPAAVQVASEVGPEFSKGVGKEVPKNGKSANLSPGNLVPSNLEEEIRRRAYELYLQRRATATGQSGDQNQDWLMAENEIRSRYGALARHTTA
jgi:hypothetical protein